MLRPHLAYIGPNNIRPGLGYNRAGSSLFYIFWGRRGYIHDRGGWWGRGEWPITADLREKFTTSILWRTGSSHNSTQRSG